MRRGRPRKDPSDRLVPLSTNVSLRLYERVYQVAQKKGLPIAEVVRVILEKKTDAAGV